MKTETSTKQKTANSIKGAVIGSCFKNQRWQNLKNMKMENKNVEKEETHKCKGCSKQIPLDEKRCKNCNSTTSKIRDEILSKTGISIPPLWQLWKFLK